MNIALRNLIFGPGQVRAVLAERLSRLRKMPECDPYDLNSIHVCILQIGGYGGLDPVLAQSSLSLLLQSDRQFMELRARHVMLQTRRAISEPPEAA